ncbi:MAG: biotin/lipoyl-binding protein, partial [Chlamydiota bacterium]
MEHIGRKYLLPILSFIGLSLAIFMVLYGRRTPPVPPIEFPPPTPPYKHYVAGAGTVEAASEDISIGTPFNEIVTGIFVKVGDFAKEDDPLFQIDTRDLEARLKEASERLEVARTNFQDQERQFQLYQSLRDKRAVSENEFNQRFYAAEAAQNELREAEAAVAVIATNIERSTIRAPIDGEVLQVNIRIGEVVEKNPFDLKAHILFGRTFPLHIRVEV